MGERTRLIGSYEGADRNGKVSRAWVFRRSDARYVIVFRGRHEVTSASHRSVATVGDEVEAIFGLSHPVWKRLE